MKFINIAVLLLVFHYLNAIAEIKWEHFSTDDGLLTNQIIDACEDPQGFIWLATRYGLHRLSAHEISHILPANFKEIGPGNNSILDIDAVGRDKLCFITTNLVGCYDKTTGKMSRIETGDIMPPYTNLNRMSDGKLLIGAKRGIYVYDVDTGSSSPLFNGHTMGTIPHDEYRILMVDSIDNIWLGAKKESLFRYSPQENHIYRYPQIDSINTAINLIQDYAGNIWASCQGNIIYRLDNPYNVNHATWKQIPLPVTRQDERITALCSSRYDHRLWIGTNRQLLSARITSDNRLADFKKYPHIKNVSNITIDSTGTLVVLTSDNGFYTGNIKEPIFSNCIVDYPPFPDNMGTTISVMEDSYGRLWAGIGEHGIIYCSRGDEQWVSPYGEFGFDSATIPGVFSILERKNGELLFGIGKDGLSIYNPATNSARTITHETSPALLSNQVMHLCEDLYGNLWIGTTGGAGVITADGHEIPTQIKDDIMGIECEDNKVAIATLNNGLYIISGDIGEDSKIEHIDTKNIDGFQLILLSLAVADDIVYLGTEDNGIYAYDMNKHKLYVTPFLPSGYNLQANIIVPYDKYLWIGTNRGLRLVDTTDPNKHAAIFTKHDGLISDYFIRSGFLKDKRLFLTSDKGVVMADLDNMSSYIYPAKDVKFDITGILFAGRPFEDIQETDKKLISGDLLPMYAEKLTIPDHLNHITLKFSILSGTTTGYSLYKYKMDGFDKDWILTNQYNNSATYINLPSGDYTFRLMASDGNGRWTTTEKKIQIKVLPPWYLTWWAITLYILAVGCAIWMLWRHSISAERENTLLHMADIEEIFYNRTLEHNTATSGDTASAQSSSADIDLDDEHHMVIKLKKIEYSESDAYFIKEITECVERNLDDTGFDIPSLAKEMKMSKTTLFNRLKILVGMNPSCFVRTVRLRASVRILMEYPDIRVSELAYKVGFNDPKYFSQCFKKEFGMTVTEYAEQIKDK